MKKNLYNITVKLLFLLFLGFQACSEKPQDSLYDPGTTFKPDPAITSVSPSEAIAVITPITITGSNFSTVPEENVVYFDGKPGTTVSSTSTQVVAIAPLVISDTVKLKIRVAGAEGFSNVMTYKLTAPVSEILKPNGDPIFTDIFKPAAIAFDNSNNLYVSVISLGVKKLDVQTSAVTDYAPRGAESFWQSLKYGPASTIYAAKNLRGVWKINEGVAPPNAPWVATPNGTSISDIDFASDKALWCVGNTNAIFRMPESGGYKSFPFTATLRSVRVFDNALYVAGLKDNIEGVWKFPFVTADSIGQPELYFNYSDFDATAGVTINAITFSAAGDLFLGTSRVTDPVIIVHQDKTAQVFYSGALASHTEITHFAWDTGNFLYFTRAQYVNTDGKVVLTQSVLKINMERAGAPYYGRI